jgi:hypothetical protein
MGVDEFLLRKAMISFIEPPPLLLLSRMMPLSVEMMVLIERLDGGVDASDVIMEILP